MTWHIRLLPVFLSELMASSKSQLAAPARMGQKLPVYRYAKYGKRLTIEYHKLLSIKVSTLAPFYISIVKYQYLVILPLALITASHLLFILGRAKLIVCLP